MCLAYVPGGQPIGAIEKRFDKFGKWLKRRFRLGRSRSESERIADMQASAG